MKTHEVEKNNRSKYVVKFASKRTGDEICKVIRTSAKMGTAMLLASSSQLIHFQPWLAIILNTWLTHVFWIKLLSNQEI